jgi:hypothetical protein
VTGKSLSLIQATWAATYAYGHIGLQLDFSKGVVLIASFQAPPSAVSGGQQAGYGVVTIDNVNVLFNGKVICGYNQLAISTDDRFHVGKTMGSRTAETAANTTATTNNVAGVFVSGFAGYKHGTRDPSDFDADSPVPGLVLFATSDKVGHAAAGYALNDSDYDIGIHDYTQGVVQGGDWNGYTVGPAASAFATVIAGTYEVNYIATDYVETNFKPSGAKIVYDKWMSNYVDVAIVNPAGTQATLQADLFDMVKVSQGSWTVVAYCPNVNINTMNSVTLQLQFADGSTWETNIPLSVQ